MNSSLKQLGVRYSTFIHQLKEKNIEIDRKMLALMANEHPGIFKKIVEDAGQK
jgi:large subunit ribosomal protein L20